MKIVKDNDNLPPNEQNEQEKNSSNIWNQTAFESDPVLVSLTIEISRRILQLEGFIQELSTPGAKGSKTKEALACHKAVRGELIAQSNYLLGTLKGYDALKLAGVYTGDKEKDDETLKRLIKNITPKTDGGQVDLPSQS